MTSFLCVEENRQRIGRVGRFVWAWETVGDGLEVAMSAGFVGGPRIGVKRLVEGARLPKYAHVGAWGDLAADLYAAEGVVMEAGATVLVSTGVAMEFPATHGALVEDRSGLAVKGITTLAGVIDPGYRGEIKVVLTNLSAGPVELKVGDRVAQLRVVARIEAEFVEVEELGAAERGSGGFGSTGA